MAITAVNSNADKALLFDLDGTILDTKALILAGMQYATRTVLGRIIPDDILLSEVGIPLQTQMEHHDQLRADELVAVYREYSFTVEDQLIACFAGMQEALEQLKTLELPMVIVTSKRNDMALRGLGHFGLAHYFDFIIGSLDTDKHKPLPDPLLLAAQRLNIPAEQCIYLGDSPYDMQAARSANMLAIAALWGMFPVNKLQDAGAQHQLANISELPGLIDKLQ